MESLSAFLVSAWEQYPWFVAAAVIALLIVGVLRPKDLGKLVLAAGLILAVVYVVSVLFDIMQAGSTGKEQLMSDPKVQGERDGR